MTSFKQITISGQSFTVKSPNSKYAELDDLDNLYKLLQETSIGQLAKKMGIPQNSIRYRVFRYFPAEWIRNIVKERAYHFQTRKPKLGQPES